MSGGGAEPVELAVFALLRSAGLTLGVAESVTGGMVSSRLSGLPGASAVFRGAVVAYHRDLKTSLLGAPALPGQVARPGPLGSSGSPGASPADMALDDRRPGKSECAAVRDGSEPAAAHSSAVSRGMALAMASGACGVLGSDVGLATTGAAGPDPHEGAEPGTVWVGLWLDGVGRARHLFLPFDRAGVRRAATAAAFEFLRACLSARSG